MMVERKTNRERGAAAVEFALVAVVLLAMIFGVIEFGRMWAIQGSLAQASRDAARTMAITDDEAAAEQQFKDVFSPLASDPDVGLTIAISRVGTVGDEGCREVVAANYVTESLTGFLGDNWTITAKGSMRCNG